jgi:hypothetical protein
VSCVFQALVRVSALLLGLCTVASAQISPGPLSRAHQQWEGVTKCSNCHDLGAGDRRFKCLECHTEIQRRVQANQGYHAKAYKQSPNEMDCARCHIEHNGQKFLLTRLDRKTFDHKAQTGFALEGKHKEQQCEACHTANRILASAKSEIKLKDLNHSFLGLKRECAGCHEDAHAGQLGADCLRCHSQDAWKPAVGFSHTKTSYPLTGQHQAVACQKCHGPKPGEKVARFKGLPAGTCQNCHADPHKGAFQDVKFQGTCETCHSTNGWTKNQPTASFNHDKTKFKLLGKHAEASCSQCHKDSDFHRPVAHDRCESCHEEIHKGQFAKRAGGGECSACHNETSFKPTLFTRESHQRSVFKLEGKHASVECVKCHQPEGKNSVYMTGKLLCKDCHADPHGGEFAGPPYANKCDSCHTQSSFQPPTFSSVQHSKTKFALTGAHAAVTCNDCHKSLAPVATLAVKATAPPNTAGAASVARQYHFSRQDCASCHKDPHQTTVACETCHNAANWKSLQTFNHGSTKFTLEGAHVSVACAACHKPREFAGKNTLAFSGTPRNCSECHADVHGGQFMKGERILECGTCHSITKWNSSGFDHDATHYPLDGFHVRVACAKCHTQQNTVNGKTVRLYRGTPTECVKCH